MKFTAEEKVKNNMLNLAFDLKVQFDAIKEFYPEHIQKVGKANRLLNAALDMAIEVFSQKIWKNAKKFQKNTKKWQFLMKNG